MYNSCVIIQERVKKRWQEVLSAALTVDQRRDISYVNQSRVKVESQRFANHRAPFIWQQLFSRSWIIGCMAQRIKLNLI